MKNAKEIRMNLVWNGKNKTVLSHTMEVSIKKWDLL